jgi:hypothetical protein
MKNIEIDGHGCCLSATCLYRKTCAQHETAGDFRSEGGFSPKINVSDEGVISCETIKETSDGHAKYRIEPNNVLELGRGFKKISKKPIYYNLRELWSMPAGAEVEFVGKTISSGYNCTIVRHKGVEHTQLSELVKSKKEIQDLIDFHKKELHKWESILNP